MVISVFQNLTYFLNTSPMRFATYCTSHSLSLFVVVIVHGLPFAHYALPASLENPSLSF